MEKKEEEMAPQPGKGKLQCRSQVAADLTLHTSGRTPWVYTSDLAILRVLGSRFHSGRNESRGCDPHSGPCEFPAAGPFPKTKLRDFMLFFRWVDKREVLRRANPTQLGGPSKRDWPSGIASRVPDGLSGRCPLIPTRLVRKAERPRRGNGVFQLRGGKQQEDSFAPVDSGAGVRETRRAVAAVSTALSGARS